MPMGYIFWLLMIIWALFGIGGYNLPDGSPYRGRIYGGWGLLTFVLIALLGWKVFGSVLQ